VLDPILITAAPRSNSHPDGNTGTHGLTESGEQRLIVGGRPATCLWSLRAESLEILTSTSTQQPGGASWWLGPTLAAQVAQTAA
jgi:hypothetical protein